MRTNHQDSEVDFCLIYDNIKRLWIIHVFLKLGGEMTACDALKVFYNNLNDGLII